MPWAHISLFTAAKMSFSPVPRCSWAVCSLALSEATTSQMFFLLLSSFLFGCACVKREMFVQNSSDLLEVDWATGLLFCGNWFQFNACCSKIYFLCSPSYSLSPNRILKPGLQSFACCYLHSLLVIVSTLSHSSPYNNFYY